jgi:hypothetical protein
MSRDEDETTHALLLFLSFLVLLLLASSSCFFFVFFLVFRMQNQAALYRDMLWDFNIRKRKSHNKNQTNGVSHNTTNNTSHKAQLPRPGHKNDLPPLYENSPLVWAKEGRLPPGAVNIAPVMIRLNYL